MKKITFLLLLLPFFVGAQSDGYSRERIAEAEMKSASALMNLAVNPNTQNYDITYHKLEFTVNPSVYFITGKVTTSYTALSPMTTVIFDLTNELTVSSVKKNGVSLSFVQNSNDELVITLPSTQATGTSATVEITYSGQPSSGEQAFTTDTHSGSPVLYTLSEPFGARDWWPCKQDLNDKVDSIDVYITAPAQYVSVSNGLQQSAIVTGTNKTTHFHHSYPIPAYLVAIAVSNYSVFTLTAGTAPNTFPVVNYVYPEHLAAAQSDLADIVPIIGFYESAIETYPFASEKYGHCEFNAGGGMEHQTVSFVTGFYRSLIAHELAHQWFGDKVTCATWKDIWLNEGFATYMASLIIRELDGNAAFIADKSDMINYITSAPNGAVYLTDSEATNVNRIFSTRLSYDKGAMVLNMLKFKLGEATFFQGLRNYLDNPAHAYGYATTEDLRSELQAASGVDLAEFFNDWVYKQGYPTYTITAQNIATGTVRFTVSQTTSHVSVPFFEMPVPVRVFGAGGQQMDLVLDNTTNGQVFDVAVPFAVTSLTFDPEKEIISQNSTTSLSNHAFEINDAITVYPNPASTSLHVALPDNVNLKKAVVHNILGQVLLTSANSTIDISTLSSGVHFITVETDAGNKTIRFIKK